MTEKNYYSIIEHYEDCLRLHGDTHRGVDWPNVRDANRRYQIMLDLVRVGSSETSILDFGCGASHLYGYMIENDWHNLKYTGLDISNDFCRGSRKKYPENKYICADVLESEEDIGVYDYVIMNGVFTEKVGLSFEDMFDYFKRLLLRVYPLARKGIAFNVMSKNVAWEREDLFHLSLDVLTAFLTNEVSRDFLIRNDYGLFEYTVYLYKEPSDD